MRGSLYTLRFICRCREENGIALIATVNNQRREIVVEGVIPKGEAPEKVKVLTIHQLGDYVKSKQKHCQLAGLTTFYVKTLET